MWRFVCFVEGSNLTTHTHHCIFNLLIFLPYVTNQKYSEPQNRLKLILSLCYWMTFTCIVLRWASALCGDLFFKGQISPLSIIITHLILSFFLPYTRNHKELKNQNKLKLIISKCYRMTGQYIGLLWCSPLRGDWFFSGFQSSQLSLIISIFIC